MLGTRRSHVRFAVVSRQGEQVPREGRYRTRGFESRVDLVAEGYGALEIAVDFDVAGEIRLDDRDFTRRKQHAAERPGSRNAQREIRSTGAAFDASVPVRHVETARARRTEQRVHDRPRVLERIAAAHGTARPALS